MVMYLRRQGFPWEDSIKITGWIPICIIMGPFQNQVTES